jgi:GAF domain-containing protein
MPWLGGGNFESLNGKKTSLFSQRIISMEFHEKPLHLTSSLLNENGDHLRPRGEQVQQATYQISQAASSANDLSELFQLIHKILGGLMPAENFYIALYDSSSDILSFPYYVDQFDQPPDPHKPGKGLTDYVLRTGEPLLASPEVFQALIVADEVEEIGAPSVDWLGVPLKIGERIIGVMVLQTYVAGPRFGQEELNIARFVSSQVAMAIDRKRSEAALRESEERYRMLFEESPISLWQEDFSKVKSYIKSHCEGVQDFKKYFEEHPEIVNECVHLVRVANVNRTTLKMYHAAKEQLLISLDKVLEEESIGYFINELIAIAQGKSEFAGEGVNYTLTGNRMHVQVQWSAAPGSEESLADVNVSVLDITAIKQAESALFDRAQELGALYAVATACAEATYEDELIERFTEIIGETLYPDKCGVLLVTPSGEALYCHPSYRGITPEDRQKLVPIHQGVTGYVAAAGRLKRVYDVSLEPNYIDTGGDSTGSELCLPLKVGERVIGVLNAESLLPGAFTEGDEHLLAILAGQLSNAMERLRAEAVEKKQARQIATIYDISQEIVGTSLDPEKVCLAIHLAVNKLMATEAFLISILNKETNEIQTVYQVDKDGRYPPHRMPFSQGLSGYVMSRGSSLKIDDLDNQQIELFPIRYNQQVNVRSILAVPMRLAGKIFGMLSAQSYQPNTYTLDDLHLLELLTAHAAIALGNAQLFEETLKRADELGVLSKVSSAMRIARTRAEMLPIILNQLCDLLKINSAALVLQNPASGEYVIELALGTWDTLAGVKIYSGEGIIGKTIAAGVAFLNVDLLSDSSDAVSNAIDHETNASGVPLLAQHRTIGALVVGCNRPFSQEEFRLLTAVADIAANAIYRTTLHEQTEHHAEQMATVSSTARALAETLDIPEIYERLANAVCGLLPDVASILIFFYNRQQEIFNCDYAYRDNQRVIPKDLASIKVSPVETHYFNEVIQNQQPLIANIDSNSVDGSSVANTHPVLYVPMLVKGEILGVIRTQGLRQNSFSQADAELLTLVGNTGAIAVENARLFKETERRLKRLAALRAMDMAISSSFDLRVTLNVMLDQVATQLGADAASVLLFNPYSQALEYAAGRGFHQTGIARSRQRLGEGLAGRTALERKLVFINDYPEFSASGNRFSGENFISYYGAPLVAKGQLKGVLEIFHRTRFVPDPEWLDFLETLAGDTAIAIDNTALFTELQRSNIELTMAYDSTLEGWSRVLELRKLESEGHTQRVVELTLNLGDALGMAEVEMVHLRRGALLHDIGKIGVPDSILLKNGPLTPQEWEIMHLHPTYAYGMLSPIVYLRPALEIPYCHHEKWDGTGYPRGLKENQIPLAARIFAVVDVWDAMRSERTYRRAYPDPEVLEYIRSESGKHFDPQVVQAFLRLIREL